MGNSGEDMEGLQDIIRLHRHPLVPYIYDVELEQIDKLREFDTVDCHVVLYPHSRKISSPDIQFHPFSEYVKDISTHQRSVYSIMNDHAGNIFGLLLGTLLAVVVCAFRPEALFSIEAIASVFGVYFIGKKLWEDIEEFLLDFTAKRRIRYVDRYYRYRLEANTTLTRYSALAKRSRYGRVSLLPSRMDFIPKSSSLTVRMQFGKDDLESVGGGPAHILSIHVDSTLISEFVERGYLFGIKISMNRRRVLWHESFELFQSINNGVKGSLDARGEWIRDSVFYRRSRTVGRLKYYRNEGTISDRSLIADE